MPDNINPYIPGQPVNDPNLFVGRRDIVSAIREGLVKGRRVFVVAGAASIGKSSLLRQLPAHLLDEFVSVRIDLSQEGSQKLDWLLWRLADAIGRQVGQQLGVAAPEAVRADFETDANHLLDHCWPQIRSLLGDRCLVLLLDDLDSLAGEKASLEGSLIDVLTAWRDRDEGLAFVVTVSAARQQELNRQYPRLFGGSLSYTLGTLSSEEALRLITWPVDGVLTYDYGVARRLAEITSGQPYYLQLLCFEVYNRCAAAGWVSQRDLDLVVENLVSQEVADFRQVWKTSSGPEQAVLAALVSLRGARGVATVQDVRTILSKAGARADRAQVTAALEHLVLRGVLERLGALSYRFRVALLRDWLSERIDLIEVVRNTRWQAASRIGPAVQGSVSPLTARKEPRHKTQPKPAEYSSETASTEPATKRATVRPWLGVGAAAVLSLVIMVAIGSRLLQAPSDEPTAVVALSTSTAVRLVTSTLTVAPRPTASAAANETPSDKVTPVPSDTSLPTPPIVVTRSVLSIAYQSREPGEKQWSVWAMNSDGSGPTRLGDGQSGFLSAPSWSPDGTKVALVSDRDGRSDIWVVDRDGSHAINLTQNEAKDHSPAWSPDGQWIAFASLRDALYWELYIMRPDGSDMQRLTWWEDASDLYPTWSPDGTRLAFASKRDGNWEIYSMDRDGLNLARLTFDPADDTNPSWSPDGSRIAFESTRDGYADIYVMPSLGGEATNISQAPLSSEHGPSWSPDGGRIAFYSDRDGEWDIYVMNADGSNVVKLTGDSTNDQVPSWRP
jgi:Tol biopolymer transport system component